MQNPNIVIAGASGYIGKAIIPFLLEKFPHCKITALSRSQQSSSDKRVEWKSCDLFSLRSIEKSIPADVDMALYLVHSMGPTAQLDQGTFADYDLILADNFARAMSKTNVRQVIYLGGLVPGHDKLSLHLKSRLEVEETFAQYRLPLTIFRAGLILGDAGSSFQILLKLVKRLPIMVCPAWTQTLTTPVDLVTVLNSITASALDPKHIGKTYDLAGCKPLTYIEMMRETARRLGLKRYFLTVPFFTPTLSRLWVSVITNSSKNLVYPLVESLEHPMVARKEYEFSDEWSRRTYFELLEKATMKIYPGESLVRFRAVRKTVRSVQRMPLPIGKDAEFVKNEYLRWLPSFLKPFIGVSQQGLDIEFWVIHPRLVMLKLISNPERSSSDRQQLAIDSGQLVGKGNHGRLEFRVVLGGRFVLAAIHEFKPSLPWYVYKFTQAKLHLWVMGAFGRHLEGLNKK